MPGTPLAVPFSNRCCRWGSSFSSSASTSEPHCKSWDALPKAAKQYVEFLEKQLGHEIQFVSTGAEREKFVLKGAWL